MKKLLTLLMVCAFTIGIFSQTPEKISYQAVVRNSDGELLKNSPVGMKISILQGSATGSAVYVETQNPTTNVNGLVSVMIGGGNPQTGTFTGINWAAGTYFIKTEIDPTGGTTYTITGTGQLLSVPYALVSKTSESTKTIPVKTSAQIETLSNPVLGTLIYNTTISSLVIFTGGGWVEIGGDSFNYTAPLNSGPVATDADGNNYTSVVIGNQTWLVQNLKATKYNDGSSIPYVEDNAEWSNLASAAYCWYNNDQTAYKNIYGAYYNWYTLDVSSNGGKNVCPVGWHVPSDDEWEVLIGYCGGRSVAGGVLKESGTTNWTSPNTGATNETGFTARPSGYRAPNGVSYNLGGWGFWWTTTKKEIDKIQVETTAYDKTYVGYSLFTKNYGVPVRCIKD